MEWEAFEHEGLILAARVREAGDDPRMLREGAERGHLLRLRRGVYCLPDRWDGLSSRERHLLVAKAVLCSRSSGVLAGHTAGAAWRLPSAATESDRVALLVPRAGGLGLGLRAVSLGYDRARVTQIRGMPCTDLARTACDMARRSDFATAVTVLDSALSLKRQGRITRVELAAELDAATSAGEGRTLILRRAVDFCTDRAESPGESIARVAIHRAGFVAPVLQQLFVDADGEMFPDFWWPEASVAAEFDGKVKYTRQEYTSGDPSEVVWREKRREDRLRRLVDRVERLTFADVMQLDRLRRILLPAGVPLRDR